MKKINNKSKISDYSSPEIPNPITFELSLSRWKWIQTLVLSLLLLPLKLTVLLLIIFLAWIISVFGLLGVSKSRLSQGPLEGWRASLQKMIIILGKFAFQFAGFYNVVIKGRLEERHLAPILVAAPHSSFLDGFVGFWTHGPIFVHRLENQEIPFLGTVITFLQGIFVDRKNSESRSLSKLEISRRASSSPNSSSPPQILLFPEGSTTNRSALLTFKVGAFTPGLPVQPLIIRYLNSFDTVTWTWNQSHGAFKVILLSLSQVSLRAEIEFLPIFVPNEDEKRNPKLFAYNVRAVMAKALGVPVCDIPFETLREMNFKKES